MVKPCLREREEEGSRRGVREKWRRDTCKYLLKHFLKQSKCRLRSFQIQM
jgi:hypothetical protein